MDRSLPSTYVGKIKTLGASGCTGRCGRLEVGGWDQPGAPGEPSGRRPQVPKNPLCTDLDRGRLAIGTQPKGLRREAHDLVGDVGKRGLPREAHREGGLPAPRRTADHSSGAVASSHRSGVQEQLSDRAVDGREVDLAHQGDQLVRAHLSVVQHQFGLGTFDSTKAGEQRASARLRPRGQTCERGNGSQVLPKRAGHTLPPRVRLTAGITRVSGSPEESAAAAVQASA